PAPDDLVRRAREAGEPQQIALACAAAARLRLSQKPQEAHALLADLDQMAGMRADPYYAAHIPGCVRTALALEQTELAARLVEGVQPVTPLAEHALAACHAQLAEAAGNHHDAASLYGDAAERWQKFGNVPERAYALLGEGRCLHTLGDRAALQPLLQARDFFASMGYKPALAETEALLNRGQEAAI